MTSACSTARCAASCTAATTKSVMVRPCSSAARLSRPCRSVLMRASSRAVRALDRMVCLLVEIVRQFAVSMQLLHTLGHQSAQLHPGGESTGALWHPARQGHGAAAPLEPACAGEDDFTEVGVSRAQIGGRTASKVACRPASRVSNSKLWHRAVAAIKASGNFARRILRIVIAASSTSPVIARYRN